MALHYRRNITCLGSNDLHDLRETLATMFTLPAADEHSFAALAGLHGNPGNYCVHGSPGFLTWHRAYMYYFEKALRCINSRVTLPFWNWSSSPTTGVPAPCAQPTYVNRSGVTVPNPLYTGPLPGGGTTTRSPGIGSASFAAYASSAQSALTSTTFSSLQNALNGPHGGVHVTVGGNMGSVAFASYDPIFYLHHGNVDRLWAIWQIGHPGSLPASEASELLEPFTLPYSTTFRPGADFATTDQLGYRYLNYCFFFPPFRFWEVVRLDLTPHFIVDEMKTARLLVKSRTMPARSAELRVFVNAPDATPATPIEGNPHFAGSIGVFGMTDSDGVPAAELSRVAAVTARPRAALSHVLVGAHAGHVQGDTEGHGHVEHNGHDHDHGTPTAAGAAGQPRFDLELEIAATLARLAQNSHELTIKIVALDPRGRPLQAENFDLEGIDLLID